MRIQVKFECDLPADATDEQISEWVCFCLGESSHIDMANPLSKHDLEAVIFTTDWSGSR